MGKRSVRQCIGHSPATRGHARMLLALLCLTLVPTPLLLAAPFEANWRGPADAFSPENMRGPNPLYRLAPINPNIGSPSGRLESDGGSATGNYHLSIPLVSFPGRGIDLQVTARYNSQIWSKMSEQGSAMFWANADGDWPVPGLNLGFGKLLFPDSPMLINPDGSRQGLTEPNWEFHVNGQHTDRIASKFTDGSGGMVACTASLMRCRDESAVHFASATQENGRRMEMIAAPGRSTFYPAKIFDANGNFIQIEYRTDSSGNPAPPSIDHISDTAGRWVQFHYDNSGLPIAISAPDQDGGVRVYVRFYYHAFKSVIHVARVGAQQSAVVDLDFPVLDAIYFPGNHTGYVFSDYTEYGIPRTVTVQRNMAASTDALDTQGTFSSGAMTRRSSFNYPDNAQGMRSRKELPAYTKRTDTWANSVNAGGSGEEQQAITTYNKERAGEHRVTGPDGTTTLQGIVTDPTKVDFGLVSWMLTATRDNRWLETRSFIWEPGVANIPRQKEVRIHNHEINAVKRIAFKYGQTNRQITEEIHYDYVAPDRLNEAKVLRRRVNRYLDHPVYAARNFTLVSETSLYDGSIANPAFAAWQQQIAHLQSNLDQARANVKPFQDAVDRAQAAVTEHAAEEPPRFLEVEDSPRPRPPVINPEWRTWNKRMNTLRADLDQAKQAAAAAQQAVASAQSALDSLQQQQPPQTIENEIERTSFFYDATTNFIPVRTNLSGFVSDGTGPRGLVTGITRLLAADAKSISGAGGSGRSITTNLIYDQTGNLRIVRDSPTSQVSYTYADNADFSLLSAIETGAVDPRSSVRNRVSMTYNRVGMPTHVIDENGVSSEITYLPGDSAWRKSTVTLSTGAKLISEYNDADLSITQKLVDAEGRQYDQTFRYDGRRLLRTTQATRRTDGGQEITEFEYDVMGRQTKQSLPRRTSKPTDNPTETLWINYGYDTAGRVTTMTEPTGTVRSWFYNEASVPQGLPGSDLGESVRTVGPWGRESWSRVDALGQLRLVVKPDPVTGRVSDPDRQVAMHSYNARGNLISLKYGEQLRTFMYDSLGRMIGVTVPERAARLDIQGDYRGNGLFSDVYQYDDRNSLVTHIDSRGAKTIYDYANDPLNRLRSISYDISHVGDTTSPVAAAPRTIFEYVQEGDRRRPQTITTEGVMQESFAYQMHGPRGNTVKVTSRFDAAPNSPLEYSTWTDSLGRPVQFTYPKWYTNGTVQSGDTFLSYTYSNDGELAQIQLSGGVLIDKIRYSINGIKHLEIVHGDARWSEDYGYDPKSGNLNNQTLISSADSRQNLIDLHYGYSDRHGTGDSGQIRVQEGVLGTAIERVHAYDAWGRLLSTKEKTDSFNGNPTQQLYSYDMYGNRLTVQAQLWSQGTGWSDLPASNTDGLNTPSISNNRIQGSDYLYDDAGNLIRGPGPSGIQRYLYDAAGRLVVVQQENGPVLETYQYGADRRRVAVSSDPDRRLWRLSVWSGNSEVARYDVDVSDATRALNWVDMPIYFGGRLIAGLERVQDSFTLKVFHADHRDTVATTEFGKMGLKPQKVMPFGTEHTETTQRDGDIRFTSYRRSEKTGLDYAINRYYDPKLGRFFQTDPLSIGAFNFSDPESWNAYTYVLNDPVNRTDPLGLEDKQPSCKNGEKKAEGGKTYSCVDGSWLVSLGTATVTATRPVNTFPVWSTLNHEGAFLARTHSAFKGGRDVEIGAPTESKQCSQPVSAANNTGRSNHLDINENIIGSYTARVGALLAGVTAFATAGQMAHESSWVFYLTRAPLPAGLFELSKWGAVGQAGLLVAAGAAGFVIGTYLVELDDAMHKSMNPYVRSFAHGLDTMNPFSYRNWGEINDAIESLCQ